MSTNANLQQKQLICRAPGCHFEVRDTEEDELIRMIQDHAERVHQTSLPVEYLRTAIQPVEGDTRALVRRFYEEVFNNQNMSDVDAFVAPDIIDHSLPPGTPNGIESVKQAVTMLLTAFPDMRLTLEDIIVEGDRVAVHWTMSGTHLGASLGMPPTGKQFTMPGVSLLRLQGGKVVEAWIIQDQLSLLQQLGLAPEPAQAAS